MNRQLTDRILMIRPLNFGYNPETAVNNSFQRKESALDRTEIVELAQNEFDCFVEILKENEVLVEVYQDTVEPRKTDSVFPNNWITFHENGEVFTFPMYSPNRRAEVRMDIIQDLGKKYEIHKIHQLHTLVEDGLFLEGTGSMVFDRTNRLAYACLSERTNMVLLQKFCEISKFNLVPFHATDDAGLSIYHTNVMMSIGTDFAIICLDSIQNPKEKDSIVGYLNDTKKTIFPISMAQMKNFAGNMLQIKNTKGVSFLVMSQTAKGSLSKETIKELEKKTKILTIPIKTIEHFGGGSVRCMMAEIFCHSR